MFMSHDSIVSACAQVNAAGIGRVNWHRKSDSSGSGKDRKAGQFHGYEISKAQVAPVNFRGTVHLMLMIWLTPAQVAANVAAGGSDKVQRNLNLGTIKVLRPGT